MAGISIPVGIKNAQFKAGFAHMAAVLKTVPGSNFTIEYNISIYNGWDPNVSMPDVATSTYLNSVWKHDAHALRRSKYRAPQFVHSLATR